MHTDNITGKVKFRRGFFGKYILMIEYKENHKSFWRDATENDIYSLHLKQMNGKVTVSYDNF
jgi:hypothetical protein